MANEGFDNSEETVYSSDGEYFCQRDGCGRSIPWGEDPANYKHCCTLCAEDRRTHSIECDADYIREHILRKPRRPGRAGRDLMLREISRERGALSVLLCKKSEVRLLLETLLRTWVRTWKTSESYAKHIRTCKFLDIKEIHSEFRRETRDIVILLIVGYGEEALGRLEIVFRSWARMVRMWRQGPRSSSSVCCTRSLQCTMWDRTD